MQITNYSWINVLTLTNKIFSRQSAVHNTIILLRNASLLFKSTNQYFSYAYQFYQYGSQLHQLTSITSEFRNATTIKLYYLKYIIFIICRHTVCYHTKFHTTDCNSQLRLPSATEKRHVNSVRPPYSVQNLQYSRVLVQNIQTINSLP